MQSQSSTKGDIRSDLDFKLWMFCALFVEADKWAYAVLDHTQFNFKHKVKTALASNKAVINYIREHNLIDLLEDQGEWFSRALEEIMKAPDIDKKQELALLLRDHIEGKTEVVDDFLSKERVLEFVQKYTVVPKEIIENDYNEFKKTIK